MSEVPGEVLTEVSSAIKAIWLMSANIRRRHAVCGKIVGSKSAKLTLVAPMTLIRAEPYISLAVAYATRDNTTLICSSKA